MAKKQPPKQALRTARLGAALKRNIARRKAAECASEDAKDGAKTEKK